MGGQARHLSIAIGRPATAVYEFARRPQNLPLWASGLGTVRRTRAGWSSEMNGQSLRLRFAPRNRHGVLDHWVTPEGGTEIHIPMRVIPQGDDGCLLLFTLLRQPAMDDAQFESDADWVMRDLARLKQLMEAES